MNAHHDFTVSDCYYVSVQDTAGYSELKLIDDDFPNFNQSAEDPAKYSKIAKFFSPMQIHAVSA